VKYIEVVVDHKKAKRVTSVRVSKIYLDALNRAEPELLQEFGYKFSVSKILEMALDSALEEIKLETGYAFYEIEQFKIDMEGLIKRLGLDKITTVDVDGVIQNIFSEYSELRLRKVNSDSEITDMVSIIEKKKQSLKDTLAQEAWQYYEARKGVEIKKSSKGFIKPTKGKTK
jgi:hypothetical protein